MDYCLFCNIEIIKYESLCVVCKHKFIKDKTKKEWNWPFPQNIRYDN